MSRVLQRVGMGLAAGIALLAVASEPLSAEPVGDAGPPRLHQLLHDSQFTEPLSELGQQVRLWIWLDWMNFDRAQLGRIEALSTRHLQRMETARVEVSRLQSQYEANLVPQYQALYTALRAEALSPEALDALAEELSVTALSAKREEAIHRVRVDALKASMAEQKDLLHTFSPEQEQRLVSSLFFLRHQVDPLTNPGTYLAVIGPTWNAGDFTSLIRNQAPPEHLDIGGLWGIEAGRDQGPNYGNVKRGVILFWILSEPVLAHTIDEYLSVRR